MVYSSATDSINAPGFTWTNDASTGMYNPVPNQVAFSCAQTEIASFNTSGATVKGNLVINGGVTLDGSPLTMSSSNLNVDASDVETIGSSNLTVLRNTRTSVATAQWALAGRTYSYVLGGTGDIAGNTYMVGTYLGSGDIIYNANGTDSGLRFPQTYTQTHFYIIKYDTNGMGVWVSFLRANSVSYGQPPKIKVDNSGNVYITVWNMEYVDRVISANGSLVNVQNGSVFKFNAFGYFQWNLSYTVNISVRNYSGDDIHPQFVDIDKTGNIIVTGDYRATKIGIVNSNGATSLLNLQPANPNRTDFGSTYDDANAFIVQYNANGIAQWAASLTPLNSSLRISAVTTDSVNNVYVVTSNDTVKKIYNGNNTLSGLTSLAFSTCQIVKYDSQGTALYIFGAVNAHVYAIIVDRNNNVFASGRYVEADNNPPPTRQIIYNKNGALSSVPILVEGNYENNDTIFVVKFNENGIAQWLAGMRTHYGAEVYMDLDVWGNVYICGMYMTYTYNGVARPVVIFNADLASTITLRAISGREGVFAIKFNSTGYAQWVVSIDGVGSDKPFSISCDLTGGYVYITGAYGFGAAAASTSTIYNGYNVPGIILPATSTIAGFIVKFAGNASNPYNLLSNLTTNDNGTYKYLLNTSSDYYSTVNIRNSANTSTLSQVYVEPNRHKLLVWYHPNWYVV